MYKIILNVRFHVIGINFISLDIRKWNTVEIKLDESIANPFFHLYLISYIVYLELYFSLGTFELHFYHFNATQGKKNNDEL